ncbi:hypothetical protein E4U53_005225, partial [Claviceps sorghi]
TPPFLNLGPGSAPNSAVITTIVNSSSPLHKPPPTMSLDIRDDASSSNPSHLLPPTYKAHITSWLAEDTPSFDPAGYVVGEQPRTATLWAKSSGVLAGRPFFDEVFCQTGCVVTWHLPEATQLDVSPDDNTKINIAGAVAAARSVAGFSLKIEVEVQSEREADEAIDAGADVVMLDNFSGDAVRLAARSLRERWKGRRQFLLEVSGGLTTENVAAY